MYICSQVFFFKQKTAYEMRISDWSSDVCSSDLPLFSVERDVDGVWDLALLEKTGDDAIEEVPLFSFENDRCCNDHVRRVFVYVLHEPCRHFVRFVHSHFTCSGRHCRGVVASRQLRTYRLNLATRARERL